MTNLQIKAAHHQIIVTERVAGTRWSRQQAIDVLMALCWIRTTAEARQVLKEIDLHGFDEWIPRVD